MAKLEGPPPRYLDQIPVFHFNRRHGILMVEYEGNPIEPVLPPSATVGSRFDWGRHGPSTNALAYAVLQRHSGDEDARLFFAAFATDILALHPEKEFVLLETDISEWINTKKAVNAQAGRKG